MFLENVSDLPFPTFLQKEKVEKRWWLREHGVGLLKTCFTAVALKEIG